MAVLKQYFSNGKLMLTGEYLVLNGATSISWPSKFQSSLTLHTTENEQNAFTWSAKNHLNETWFECQIHSEQLTILSSNFDKKIAENLEKILIEANNIKKYSFNKVSFIETYTEWPLKWGLGSSSALIANICSLFQINWQNLFSKVTNGSGYDIACALSNVPILYKKDEKGIHIIAIELNKIIQEHSVLVYLGKKVSSENSIFGYSNLKKDILTLSKKIQEINLINEKLLSSQDILSIIQLFSEHETIIAEVLQRKTVKNAYFNTFNGIVKSCGAWGGDFVIFIGQQSKEEIKKWVEKNTDLACFYFHEVLKT